MQASSLALAIATGAFAIMLLWRVRPSLGAGRRGRRAALKEAQAHIEAAGDDPARALALCDAADLMAARLAGSGSAQALYMRAMRADPSSVEVVSRTVAGLERRPRTLESVLWRHLSAGPWNGPMQTAMLASLDALRSLYEGPLRNGVRARALANLRGALKAEASTASAGASTASAATEGGPQPGGQKTVGSA
jgi:hypothetical protein